MVGSSLNERNIGVKPLDRGKADGYLVVSAEAELGASVLWTWKQCPSRT